MYDELGHLITLVTSTTDDVQTVVDTYFQSVEWSLLKAEYKRMTPKQKRALIVKLTGERK